MRQTAKRRDDRGGRERLIDAAVTLGSSARGIASLGLRERARQAGLNPNTFYRHFKDVDDLGLAVIDQLSSELRTGLRARRDKQGPTSPRSLQRIVRESIDMFFAFVLEHRAAYVIGIRELHGSSRPLRIALRAVLDQLADEMTDDAMRLIRIPELDRATVHELSNVIIRQMSVLALEYIEQPDAREALRRQAERFILLLFWGALAAKAPYALAHVDVTLPER